MKRNLKRFSCLLLAVVLSVTMVAYAAPQAAAASVPMSIITEEALKAGASATVTNFLNWLADEGDEDWPNTIWNGNLQSADNCVFTTMDNLYEMQYYLHSIGIDVVIAEHTVVGGYVLQLASTTMKHPQTGKTKEMNHVIGVGFYYMMPSGKQLVGVPNLGEDIGSENYRHDIWLPFTTAISKKQVSVLTKDSLSDLCVTINQTDRTCSVRDTIINEKSFYVIIDTRNNIYANADGVPYVAHYEATVTDQGRDYIINEGDTLNEGDTIYNDNSTIIEGSTTNYEIVDNSKVVDLTNGTLNYIGEQNLDQFYIDELLYDFSSQSYSADTYNVTYDNDTYNTWNYTWNITYNITNTYVTNIGQTELYKPLELYYALPDGRSSADLTAEEIAGMSFEFADCVNYAKSATDTYLRALYHFDGNTDDSSYFSTQGKFEWVEGASITYMDVGTFDGALYLGPEKHQFKITLFRLILRNGMTAWMKILNCCLPM